MAEVTPTLISVSPNELSTSGNSGPRKVTISNVSPSQVVWSIKSAPGLCAMHKFTPHDGVLSPNSSIDIEIRLDTTVLTDSKHKDKILIIHSIIDNSLLNRSVVDVLGNAKTKVARFKILVNHDGIPEEDQQRHKEEEEEERIDSKLPREVISDLSPKTVVDQSLRKSGSNVSVLEYKTIFATYFGSKCYNLTLVSTPVDTDVYGVYLAPLKSVLSVRAHLIAPPFEELIQGQRLVSCNSQIADLDVTIRELSNFCGLLVNGSPNTIEMLFVKKEDCFADSNWWKLVDFREHFITRRFVSNYLGWASAALHSLKRQKSLKLRRKAVCHGMRIVFTARKVLEDFEKHNGDSLKLQIEGKLRDQILSIKRGEQDGQLGSLIEQVQLDISSSENLISVSSLPENVDSQTIKLLNDWIYQLRISSLSK